MLHPSCPVCGAALRVWRKARGSHGGRSHSHTARATSYVCPVAEAEVTEDARGHLHRQPAARHARTQTWTVEELEAQS
jgi:hypothetical protein